MNREDIIRMYKEANGWSPKGFDITVDELERFAELVAATEREACANLVFHSPPSDEYESPLKAVYDAIRARGQA
jgi:hypothetical protein